MKSNLLIILLLISFGASAQIRPIGGKRPVDIGGVVNPTSGNTSQPPRQAQDTASDGFTQRDDLKDSVTISFRFLDSTRRNNIDSSVNDFDNYFSVPSSWAFLGNNGAAAFPLVFQQEIRPGFDPGFHAFDLYKFKLEDTRIYRTTKPFSTLGYMVASGKEQMIQAMHTQNPRQNINWGIDYRLITSPGFFITQNTNHNNMRLYGDYQGKRKRYKATVVLQSNNLRASENGGVVDDASLLDPNKKQRFAVNVNLGNSSGYYSNPFQTTVYTGNAYRDFTFFLRQSYDLGKRDSVAINDSTNEYLFYPKLRLQHSFSFNKQQYKWNDVFGDSLVYKTWYNVNLRSSIDTFGLLERWKIITNDFSIYQFPDTKNASQFIMAGVTMDNIKGFWKTDTGALFNLKIHGEYRNRTRNKKWDINLKGEFFTAGLNIGDYSAYANLSRFLNSKWGYINLFFKNVNRRPSFVFDDRSSFNLGNNLDLKKENIIVFGASAVNPWINLSFANYTFTNLAYFKNFYQKAQYSTPVNIIQFTGAKEFKITKKWNYYVDAAMQLTTANSPITLPLLFVRNRLAYEGKLYKNLNQSMGLEVRYYTPYKAPNYSPLLGQFFPQNSVIIKNLPDVNAFLHFRIKPFTAYIRAENLNTIYYKNGLKWLNNNFSSPHYPTPGFLIRVGVRWWFVN